MDNKLFFKNVQGLFDNIISSVSKKRIEYFSNFLRYDKSCLVLLPSFTCNVTTFLYIELIICRENSVNSLGSLQTGSLQRFFAKVLGASILV